jgi:HEAT repeat protein
VGCCAASALASFGEIGDLGIHTLIVALAHSEGDIRATAARLLGRFTNRSKEVIPPLISSLRKDKDPKVRSAAASSLYSVGRHTARNVCIPALIDALRDQDLKVRCSVLDYLHALDPKPSQVLLALIDGLKHEDLDFRVMIVEYIGSLGAEASGARPALEEALKDSKDESFRNAILAALSKLK